MTYNLFEKFDLIRPKTQILPLERKAFISLKKKKKKQETDQDNRDSFQWKSYNYLNIEYSSE